MLSGNAHRLAERVATDIQIFSSLIFWFRFEVFRYRKLDSGVKLEGTGSSELLSHSFQFCFSLFMEELHFFI